MRACAPAPCTGRCRRSAHRACCPAPPGRTSRAQSWPTRPSPILTVGRGEARRARPAPTTRDGQAGRAQTTGSAACQRGIRVHTTPHISAACLLRHGAQRRGASPREAHSRGVASCEPRYGIGWGHKLPRFICVGQRRERSEGRRVGPLRTVTGESVARGAVHRDLVSGSRADLAPASCGGRRMVFFWFSSHVGKRFGYGTSIVRHRPLASRTTRIIEAS